MRTDRRTDGQTDMVIPVYPPNFVAGDIMKPIGMDLIVNLRWSPMPQLNQTLS